MISFLGLTAETGDSDPFSFRSFGRRQAGQVLIDAVVAGAVWLLANLVFFGGAPPASASETMWTILPVVMFGKPAVNFLLGHYRRLWRFTGLADVVSLHLGSLLVAAVLGLTTAMTTVTITLPVIVLDAALFMLAAPGIRLFRRVQRAWSRQGRIPFLQRGDDAGADRVLIVGADEAADSLLRDLGRSGHRDRPWTVVGLLDDDPGKRGSNLHGAPVLGSTTDLERIAEEKDVDRVVVSMPLADEALIQNMVRRARSAGVQVSRLPSAEGLVNSDRPAEQAASSVTLEDLKDVTEVRETLLEKLHVNGGSSDTPVLVTGGAGYIGSHLVRHLLDEGHKVRVLDSLLYGDRGIEELRDHPDFELMEGDICNVRDVTTAIRDVDKVIALAAIVGDPACGIDAEATLNLNFESTKILAEACNFYDVDRIVFASTCSVYGAKDDGLLDESSSLNPVSLYARTRIMSENVLLERLSGPSAPTPVLLRLATVFGLSPRMRFDLVVNALTVRGVVDGKFQVFGGDQWRPFVHCSDAARAFYLAATAPKEKVDGEVFNVGSTDLNYQISKVGEIVASEIPNSKMETVDKEVDARNYRVSCDKIARVLGYEAEYDVRTGVREMADTIRSRSELQKYRDDIFSNVQVLEDRFATPQQEMPTS